MVKTRKKILIVSHDKIGSAMAGPGIRYHYMAEVLSGDFDVTVGFFDKSYLPDEKFTRNYKVRHVDAYYFTGGFENIDIVIAHWLTSPIVHYCRQNNILMVFDFYVPGPVENLMGTIYGGKLVKPEDDAAFDHTLEMYHVFFDYGDLFLFSNRRQLDFWTGYAFGARTIHLSSYQKRQVYERFLYSPMGIDTRAPIKHERDVIKGVVKGVGKKDKVLLWTGGIWNHFDGQVLIHAMKALEKDRPDIKLVFFGTQHPNSHIPEMKESLDTRSLANKLGLTDKTVFFMDGWVRYPERINYLLEADAAINTHKDIMETEFSHRTRVLDHILTGLPTISTVGDYLSDEVVKPLGLGAVVPPGDSMAIAKAIKEVLDPKVNKAIKESISKVKAQFDWQATLGDLKNFLLENPRKLEILPSAVKLKPPNPALKVARKVVPVPVKKIIVRTLKQAGLK